MLGACGDNSCFVTICLVLIFPKLSSLDSNFSTESALNMTKKTNNNRIDHNRFRVQTITTLVTIKTVNLPSEVGEGAPATTEAAKGIKAIDKTTVHRICSGQVCANDLLTN